MWFRVRTARRVHSNTNALPVCVSLAQTLTALVFLHQGSEVMAVVVVCGVRCACAWSGGEGGENRAGSTRLAGETYFRLHRDGRNSLHCTSIIRLGEKKKITTRHLNVNVYNIMKYLYIYVFYYNY